MNLDRAYARDPRTDWLEELLAAFDLGLPACFNFEWLIDRVDRQGRYEPW
ncbi:MAG: hypothetical protein OXN84_06855 [Albidovulum sp.]|nr:hypothetical protein [Albidovulum sp.]